MVQDDFQTLLQLTESNLKAGLDQIRYELARKRLSKTPAGTDIYLEQSIDLLANETLKVLNETKALIFKPKEWEPIRTLLYHFIEEQCNEFNNFLVNNWEQTDSHVKSQLILLKSSILRESNTYIDRQKIKLSKGEQTTKDLIKIIIFGLAAGLFGFLLKILISH